MPESESRVGSAPTVKSAQTPSEWKPTLSQMLRAGVQMLGEAVKMAFARKEAFGYTSGGQRIQGAIYYPESSGRAPAVLLLHTASGLTPHEHVMASRLAKEGYAALVIPYASRTTGAVIKDAKERARIEQITMDGMRALRTDPRVDSNRTAVIGLSLGGYLATHLAACEIAPMAAVVYYGMYAISESMVAALRAPLLILQGDRDSADFVMNAKKVKELSARYQKPCELVMYQAAGHQFDLFAPSCAATRDAWERTLSFLNKRLNG